MKNKILLFLVVAASLSLMGCQATNEPTMDAVDTTVDVVESDIPYETAAEELIETFTIESELKDCVGVGPMKCMVVNGNFFYDKIDGFEFEAGYKYELKVKKELAFGTDDPAKIPADANMYSYKLVEVVSKTAAIPENCKAWFDGCNNCKVGDDGLLACTRKFCAPEAMEEPKCLEFEE